MDTIKDLIETTFDQRQELDLGSPSAELRDAIHTAIELLDSGEARVAEPKRVAKKGGTALLCNGIQREDQWWL